MGKAAAGPSKIAFWAVRVVLAAAGLGLLLLQLPLAAAQSPVPSGTQEYLTVAGSQPQEPSLQLPLDAVGPAAVTVADVWLGTCKTGAPELPVVELGIAAARRAMLAGQLTCSGLVAAYLQRIRALDKPLRLNAVRVVSPAAQAEAEAADELLAAALANGTDPDDALPPLFCTPLLVKDNYDAMGMATTAGEGWWFSCCCRVQDVSARRTLDVFIEACAAKAQDCSAT